MFRSTRDSARTVFAMGLTFLAAVVLASQPRLSGEVVMEGWLNTMWACSFDDPASRIAERRFTLTDDQGRVIPVMGDALPHGAAGDGLGSASRRVVLRGAWTAVSHADGNPPGRAIRVRSLELLPTRARTLGLLRPEPALGPRPYLSILVRFADQTNATPTSPSFFQGLLGEELGGMQHYFREISFDQLNLTRSRAVGWYTLPEPLSGYIETLCPASSFRLHTAPDGSIKLLRDAIAAANPDVHFPDYAGINIVYNANACIFLGGRTQLNVDGQSRDYGLTWIGANVNSATLAHEIGHALGLPHSSGASGRIDGYDSRWDVMSSGFGDGPFRGIGAGTIAYHKDLLGWIPPERRYVAAPGTEQTILLDRLHQPGDPRAYLMAQIPVFGLPDLFFTVEARRRVGYDRSIPSEGIVIHRVDPARWRFEPGAAGFCPALVVDRDRNGDVNDAGAVLGPGETFHDPAHKVEVRVEAATSTGYLVTVRNLGTILPGHGLAASYSNSLDLTSEGISGVDPTPYFNWVLAAPHPTIRADLFSARWIGFIEPQFTENYTFYTQTDDGVRLWVNGELLINQWIDQGQTEHRGSIRLEAGRKYPIRMEFYERWGEAIAKLLWSSPSTPRSFIPPDRLYLPTIRKRE